MQGVADMTIFKSFLCFFTIMSLVSSSTECRRPNSGRPKGGNVTFVEYSCYDRHKVFGHDPGIGNILNFFPTIYMYAMVTGRDVIIPDRSHLGNWCRALNCGFPFLSEVEKVHPALKNINKVRGFGIQPLSEALTKNVTIDDVTMCIHGISAVSSGWFQASTPETIECISSITGCAHKDVGCVERFAFQRLVVGGMNNGSVPSPLVGVNQSEFDDLVHGPYLQQKRFDGAVHMRTQLSHLERHYEANISAVESLIGEYVPIFEKINEMISSYYFKDPVTSKRWRQKSSNVTEWPRIFVTCDDVTIRAALLKALLNRTVRQGLVWPIYINSSKVIHTGKTDDLAHKSQPYVDTAFDWYVMSLSNTAFAWRRKFSSAFSTFAQSALRVSLARPEPSTMKAFLLINKNGKIKWIPIWDW
jgi:hypothetical protein